MNIVYFLLPLALLMGLTFLASFVAAAWKGQYDDLETPAHRMLLDDDLDKESERRFQTSKTKTVKKGI